MLVNVSALKIHLSEVAHEAIMAFPEFVTECRGKIFVKVVQKHSAPCYLKMFLRIKTQNLTKCHVTEAYFLFIHFVLGLNFTLC